MPTAVLDRDKTGSYRFNVGDSVCAKVADSWVTGEVVAVGVEGMAYRVRLIEEGKDVYAPRDTDWFVRKEAPGRLNPETAAATNNNPTGSSRRFQVEVKAPLSVLFLQAEGCSSMSPAPIDSPSSSCTAPWRVVVFYYSSFRLSGVGIGMGSLGKRMDPSHRDGRQRKGLRLPSPDQRRQNIGGVAG